MMTAEELRLHRLKRKRIVITGGSLAILIVFGYFGGRPTLNGIKAWQARRHASKAFAFIEKENWTDARKEATAAFQLRPSEPQSVRAVARFLSRTKQPDALEFWQQLEKLTLLTPTDRRDEATIAIMSGETDIADAAVHALTESKNVEPNDWLLAAQVAIQKGAADDAMSALRKVFDDPHAAEAQQLQAALLELSIASGSETVDERANDAWSRIEKISTGKSETSLDALVLLARRTLSGQSSQRSEVTDHKSERLTNNEEPITRELSQQLASHPLAKAPQKLLALDLLERADASKRDELVAQGIDQWKNGDAKDLLALATWLNSKNEFEKTIENIPIEKAVQSRELFLQYVDALGALDRWSDVKQLLESDRYPLDQVAQTMYLARCNAQLGEKAAAENNWRRALEAAGSDPSKLITLADYAEKNGINDVAQAAFDNAVVVSPRLRVAQQGRLRMAQRSGDTKKIHAVLADMLHLWPNDAAIQNDEGYTRLLLQMRGRSEMEDGRSAQNSQSPNFQLPTPTAPIPSPTSQLPSATAPVPSPNSQLPSSADDEIGKLAALAENLVARNPRSLPHRTFLALARLKQNRPADALAVYENIAVARNALTPSALAIHSAVLAANGRTEEAKSEAAQIKPEQLLPEERALLPSY